MSVIEWTDKGKQKCIWWEEWADYSI